MDPLNLKITNDDSIQELYLWIQSKVDKKFDSESKMNQEFKLNQIVEYIKNSFKSLLENKQPKHDIVVENEDYVKKIESDLRNHIKIEYEMKLHIEYQEGRINEIENLEKQNKILNEKIKKINETIAQNEQKEYEIIKLKEKLKIFELEFSYKENKMMNEINELNTKLLSYEESKLTNRNNNIKSTSKTNLNNSRNSNLNDDQNYNSFLLSSNNNLNNKSVNTSIPDNISNLNSNRIYNHRLKEKSNTQKFISNYNKNLQFNTTRDLKFNNIEFKVLSSIGKKALNKISSQSNILQKNSLQTNTVNKLYLKNHNFPKFNAINDKRELARSLENLRNSNILKPHTNREFYNNNPSYFSKNQINLKQFIVNNGSSININRNNMHLDSSRKKLTLFG